MEQCLAANNLFKMAETEVVSTVEDLYKNFGILADAKEKAGEVRAAGAGGGGGGGGGLVAILITNLAVTQRVRSHHQGIKRRCS